jgi:hypothetical protein
MKTFSVVQISPVPGRDFAFARLADGRTLFVRPRLAAQYAAAASEANGGQVHAFVGRGERGDEIVTAWTTGPFGLDEPAPSYGGDGLDWAPQPGRGGWLPVLGVIGIDECRVTRFDGGWPMPLAVIVLTADLWVKIGGSNNQMHVPAGTRVLVEGQGSRTGGGRPRTSARVTVLENTPEATARYQEWERAQAVEVAARAAEAEALRFAESQEREYLRAVAESDRWAETADRFARAAACCAATRSQEGEYAAVAVAQEVASAAAAAEWKRQEVARATQEARRIERISRKAERVEVERYAGAPLTFSPFDGL